MAVGTGQTSIMAGIATGSRVDYLFVEVISAFAAIISDIGLKVISSVTRIARSGNRTKQTSIPTLGANITCVIVTILTDAGSVIGVKGEVEGRVAAEALEGLVILVEIASLAVV